MNVPQAESAFSRSRRTGPAREDRSVRRLLPFVVALAAFLLPAGGAAAASPTVRLAIIHVVNGCHVWAKADSTPLSAKHVVVVKRGGRLQIRINCPMDFVFSQLAGPKLDLGDPLTHSGTVRTIVFRKAGTYTLRAGNVQSSEQLGLQTLGPDNQPVLTVKVAR